MHTCFLNILLNQFVLLTISTFSVLLVKRETALYLSSANSKLEIHNNKCLSMYATLKGYQR